MRTKVRRSCKCSAEMPIRSVPYALTLLSFQAARPALRAFSQADLAAGRWEGAVQVPGRPFALVVDLAPGDGRPWMGSAIAPGMNVKGAPPSKLTINGAGLGVPTHGVVDGGRFYFIANSGWDRLADDGPLKPGAVFESPTVPELRIQGTHARIADPATAPLPAVGASRYE